MKVFLSYSFNDNHIVNLIQNQLHQNNIDTLSLDSNIQPGEMIFERIGDFIKNSQVYLIFLSKNSETNRNVLNERDYIFSEWKNDPSKKIIPIILDKNVNIPLFLDQFVFIDFSNNEKIQKNMPLLVNSITRTPDRSITGNDVNIHIENYIKTNKERLEFEKIEYKKEFQAKSKKSFLYILIYCYVLIGIFVLIFSTNILHLPPDSLPYIIGFLSGVICFIVLQFIFLRLKKNDDGRSQ